MDSTAPEINSISGLDKPIINAQKVRVTYSVYDTIALKSVKVYVDGKLKDEITDFSGDSNNYEGSFTLHEKTKAQKVKIIVEDKAGNVTDTSKKSFKKNSAFTFYDSVTVSTSFYVRALAWWKQHIVGAAIAAAIVAATAVFLWLVWKRRKKKHRGT